MARPKWLTKAGNLGVIAEREFYRLPLEVSDPDNEPITFSLVGGTLPRGITLGSSGTIEGTPFVRTFSVVGVPAEVSEDVESTFVVRATTQTGDVSDRTFTLTVSGQDAPRIATSIDTLGEVLDGEYFEYRLLAIDPDEDTLRWSIKDGELPPGLTLDPVTGVISGYVGIDVDEDYGLPGWEKTEWDTRPWDFSVQTIDRNYQFTVAVTDGKDYDIKTFKIYVISNDSLDEDGDGETEEFAVRRRPALLTPAQNLGILTHDNYFAYKFEGYDFDGDLIEYLLDIPEGWPELPGLTLDINTGWLYGYIPDQEAVESFYRFQVSVRKRDYPERISNPKTFEFSVIGRMGYIVSWITDTNLGTIRNGEASEFQVEATNTLGNTLFYRLAGDFGAGVPVKSDIVITSSGNTIVAAGRDLSDLDIDVYVDDILLNSSEYSLLTYGEVNATYYPPGGAPQTPYDSTKPYIEFVSAPSVGAIIRISGNFGLVSGPTTQSPISGKLPQGLRLEPDGIITGRTSFNGFSLDGGSTTFDKNQQWTVTPTVETTFDRSFTFNVTVYDLEGQIEATKSFTIYVELPNIVPYDNLYGIALMSQDQRTLFNEVMSRQDLFPDSDVYRKSDIFFGKASEIRMLLASGLSPVQASEIQAGLETNHYLKKITLGEVKSARALNEDGSVRYEVVYLEVTDSLVNPQGQSVRREINLGNINIADGYSNTIYPNSFPNMRDAVYEKVPQVDKQAFPLWMKSEQEDGTIPGFTPAVVLCYTKPGKSKSIAFNLQQKSIDFERFDITLDRYIWDCDLSKFYDEQSGKFLSSQETTFDKFPDNADYPYFAVVDFATDLAFSQINNSTIESLSDLGGIDGVRANLIGKTLVFVKQEGYSGLAPYETGWELYTSTFDSALNSTDSYEPGAAIPGSFDADSESFDQYEIIPGYLDRNIVTPVGTTVITGQGAQSKTYGIWRIVEAPSGTLGPTGLLRLQFETLVPENRRVGVRTSGAKYGGKQLYFNSEVTPGLTQPTYQLLPDAVTQVPTTFDNNGTRFLTFKEDYADVDRDDKYLKFPQIGVFE